MSSLPSTQDRQQPGLAVSIGQLGMVLLLASITVLFFASCIAVLVTFHQATFPDSPELIAKAIRLTVPWGVLGSSGILVGISASLQRGLSEFRRERSESSLSLLRVAVALSLLFLGAQGLNAVELMSLPSTTARHSLFLFAFNLLIGLHAAHVVGGVIYLIYCLKRLQKNDPSGDFAQRLKFCVQYWHYLGLVWIPLVATLLWVQ